MKHGEEHGMTRAVRGVAMDRDAGSRYLRRSGARNSYDEECTMQISVRSARTVHQAIIAVLLLGPVTAVSGRVVADQPADEEWNGRWVVPKHRKFTLRETEGGPTRPARIDVYRVDQVKAGSLHLTPAEHGKSGWSDASQVVPVEQAVAFFSEAIGKSPRDPHNYALRAMVLLDSREDRRAVADCEEAIRLDPS